MRLALSAIAALLFLIIATPVEAPAQFGRILGPLAGPVNSIFRGGIRRPHARWSRSRVVRRTAPPVAAAAAATAIGAGVVAQGRSEEPQRPTAQGQMFWAEAPQDVFDYVFLSKEAGLWSHGFGTIVGGMFAQPLTRRNIQQSEAGDNAQTTGASDSGAPICGEVNPNDADNRIKQLRDRLAFTKESSGLVALRDASLQSDSDITAACPYDLPAELPERLRVMQDRLWNIRVALTKLREPLQKFSDELNKDQRAKFDAQAPSERVRRASAGAPPGQCFVLTQLPQPWPTDQVARAVRPEKEQQEALGVLSGTSSNMAQLMMSACPQTPPATAMARLDVALNWIDTMIFAATNIVAPVDDFYRSLSNEQKPRLDNLKL
jgi:hypothetical protein